MTIRRWTFPKWVLLGLAATFAVAHESFGQDKAPVEALLAARLPAEELEQGWIRLFDGNTMMGWVDAGKANWRVEDGTLVADQGENGLLCTTVPFRNYELQVEFWADESTNSGVFLRTPPKPTDPGKDCFELNIAPVTNAFPTGSFVYRQKVSEQVDAPKSREWHRFQVLLEGDKAKVWLDGKECLSYTDPTNLNKGRIGLQFREGKVAFRNIKLRPIGDTILPGKQEAFLPAVKVEASWGSDGSLTIVGGRGHVETKRQLGNGFVQFAATTLTSNVNSGVFFRCIPGEDMNGYECQLHHGFKADRTDPVDSGTGAIFRRQAARAVLSDEGKKAFVTIVAEGPRIATWVHGVQVVDWEDTRKADPNPRRGLRTEAGSLMLQGHDPASQVRFETLRLGDTD
ncbi:hypothetical protein VN12_12230 [Pirellula sp. SH-Sr6A]|uniref:3-keto-disaccharide hydrolase n=1 Tax=Pirellula sp. SH-Sr6A TaxID=1632865 RepID=UPI00078C9E48|nr:DUF1080 domain-containing protein [Pirellula sp. SH-Sr6A]AMV32886.1 hypothetical protein VN12_12230 [Pirellula sp. SH-Sr6A]